MSHKLYIACLVCCKETTTFFVFICVFVNKITNLWEVTNFHQWIKQKLYICNQYQKWKHAQVNENEEVKKNRNNKQWGHLQIDD